MDRHRLMLNMKDINFILEHRKEPKELQKIRKLITKSFKDLDFVEDVHKYYVPDGNGGKMELPSVSATIKQWEPEVDWDEVCQRKAANLGVSYEGLKKEWHERNIISTSCGSKTHFFGENAMNMLIGRDNITRKSMPFQYTQDEYLIPYCEKEWAITKYQLDILSTRNVYPVLPEIKFHTKIGKYNFKYNYAGTMDILLAFDIDGKIGYSIQDYKTNKDLYNEYNRNNGICMLKPFDDLFEEPFSHYAIQLSLYQIGLMQLGLNVIDRRIVWLHDDGTYEKIRTPDLTAKLIPLLENGCE